MQNVPPLCFCSVIHRRTSTSSSAVNVCAGNYNLSITDDNGCSIDTNITLIDPAALIIPGLTVVDLACYEGYQDLSAPVQNFDGDITILVVADVLISTRERVVVCWVVAGRW